VDPIKKLPTGLVSSHCYSVIWADEVDTEEEGLVRLLKLRNPWGHKEWQGDWSDKSTKWTLELKKQLKMKAANDGIFYINYENYLEYYDSTTICKTKENFSFSNLALTHPRG
jgi:calpain-15